MRHIFILPIASRFKLFLTHHGCLNVALYHQTHESDHERPPPVWYRIAYAKLIRLSHVLNNFERRYGKLNIANDDHIGTHFRTFNSLAKAFIRFPRAGSFDAPSEARAVTLDSLTKVGNVLGVSAQQRKNVRLTICPQVTQHHIWRGALEEVLRDLNSEIAASSECTSPSVQMGRQILTSCTNFFADVSGLASPDSPSWMRPAPLNKGTKPLPPRRSRQWEEVLDMFVDLSECLQRVERLVKHVSKLEAMKEGLYQIKDFVVERDISYKEVTRQDCLVQRKLSKSLGHSSKCLFTLLLYYLYGTTRDIEVDLCGGLQRSNNKFDLCVGEIVTSCEEERVLNGIKTMNRALGVFKFVWEAAAMNGELELQGHVWCMGAEERVLTYRGNKFFVHNIRLCSENSNFSRDFIRSGCKWILGY